MRKTDRTGKPYTSYSELKGNIEEEELPKIGREMEELAPPDTFRIGRNTLIQFAKRDRDLFTDLEERGKVVVKGIDERLRPAFLRFRFAMGQLLYNQSYQTGNTEANTGLLRREAPDSTDGKVLYNGAIVASLNRLCELAYGLYKKRPATKQLREMEDFIEQAKGKDLEVTMPDGSIITAPLFSRVTYQKSRGAMKYYLFSLHPLFSGDAIKSYALYPQDVTIRLAKALEERGERWTPAHHLFLEIAGAQDRRKPFVRNIDTLVEELELTAEYRMHRLRTESRIIAILEVAKIVGVICNYRADRGISFRGQEYIEKITCYFEGKQIEKK